MKTAIRPGVSWEPDKEEPIERRIIVPNMPFADYLKSPHTGSTEVRQFLKSPGHYRYYRETVSESTPSQFLGTLTHCVVLEPDEVRHRYKTAPQVDRRTTAGKKVYAEFLEQLGDRLPVTAEQVDTAYTIKDALGAMPEFRKLMYPGVETSREVSAFTVDPDSGRRIKARSDVLRADGVIADLKTTSDASPHGFARSILSFGYHIQAAYYLDVFGPEYTRFAFVAVETKPPFAAGIYWIDEASIELGRQQYKKALLGMQECEKTNHWPVGYGEQEISLPAYAFYENETEGEIEL
jgi:exodeoxyribonuclease VIII